MYKYIITKIEAQLPHIVFIILLVIGGYLLFHFFNPLSIVKNWLTQKDTNTILYEPGKDPQIHELLMVDSIKDVDRKKDNILRDSIESNLKSQIKDLRADIEQSLNQESHLTQKHDSNKQQILNIKPGQDKAKAINDAYIKRHWSNP